MTEVTEDAEQFHTFVPDAHRAITCACVSNHNKT